MIKYPEHIVTALGLCSTMNSLYEKGVLSVGQGGQRRVQMDKESFHEAFKTWFVEYRTDGYEEHHHVLFDVDFFCLVKKEENDVQS